MPDEEIHKSKTEARAASTPHVTRYVLPISLLLVVIIFAAIILI